MSEHTNLQVHVRAPISGACGAVSVPLAPGSFDRFPGPQSLSYSDLDHPGLNMMG